MSGLSIAESTVERTTEAIGCELGRAVEAKVVFGKARPWDWHRDADGQTCNYVSLDLTGIAKQGPGGAAAEGEMVAVGMVYNPIPEDRARWATRSARDRPGRPDTWPAWRGRRPWPSRCANGRSARHGPGAAVDRHQRWRRGAGGLVPGPLRSARRGDPGLLPRLGTPGDLRQGVVRRRRGRRRRMRRGRTGSSTRAGRRSWAGSRAWISRPIPGRGRPGRTS